MTKTITFDENQVKIMEMALEVFINTLDGKNNVITIDAIRRILREYVEDEFASVHSQGG